MTAEQIDMTIRQLITSTSGAIESTGLMNEMVRHAYISNVVDLVVGVGLVLLGFYLRKLYKQKIDENGKYDDQPYFLLLGAAIIAWVIAVICVFSGVQGILQLTLAPKACLFRYVVNHLHSN
ncbi:hypothetical protein UFOVP276_85 [uncultured Caudovirales phage]|uniref:Uncharacterized protein n=1 Tax=uncultured Caudovirales phage TaxID=2100421 RepID=A0A6J5LF40_9CAUD|nr:hypothetical protein UFOVP127_222 [uncultured Caudovirales phage]CAB4135129.1 hypothetical protein UFOVP276_85 [uncultured Caudovirales phage]